MTPYYADDWLTVYHGDARSVIAELPAESVHCVVTSPPYWGLRDYGTASWEGGDEGCDHRIGRVMGNANKGHVRDVLDGDRTVCSCGARRIDSQLGLEPTPEQYVENMVTVFREVRRVLRSDGTVWLNLGDSYHHASGGYNPDAPSNQPGHYDGDPRGNAGSRFEGRHERGLSERVYRPVPGLKPKDLVGIPWRVAFALQADGWYLRSDIIWSKPNPMPESVTDRPTKSHEYLFLLSKSARYYYDADAVREPTDPWAANHPDSWATGLDGGHDVVRWSQRAEKEATTHGNGEMRSGRNLRSVWSIATAPYPGAHFATFPPKLVEPCIKAGTSEKGVCPECGAPWVRETSVDYDAKGRTTNGPRSTENRDFTAGFEQRLEKRVTTTGWRPSCMCQAKLDAKDRPAWDVDADYQVGPPVPATVLDPFAGSGTTGMVAQSLSRRAVLIDLSMDYLAQLMHRNREIPLGLTEEAI